MSRTDKLTTRGCIVACLGACIGVIGSGKTMVPAVAGQAPRARLEVRIGVAPTAFAGSDGRTHLAYELTLASPAGGSSARLDRVEVFADTAPEPLASYAGSDLDQRVMRPGAPQKERYGRVVVGGATAVVHVWITLERGQAIPRSLRHSLIALSSEDGSTVAAGEARVDVRSAAPRVVGRPFRAGVWFAHNGPGQHRSAHWGSVLVNESVVKIPQRYAIDFIGVDDNGRAVRGDYRKSTNEDWNGFGREILAGVDGVVHAARDGVADNPPLVELPPPASPSAADTYGNYVIIAAPDGTFLHYAHLQRGSVAVKTGQVVRRGQTIGRLGNSGNTNGAHLHFNVTDTASAETAQGLPYVFDSFESVGRTTAEAALGAEPSPASAHTSSSTSTQRNALLLDGAVVRFHFKESATHRK